MGDYREPKEKKLIHEVPGSIPFMTVVTWFSVQEILDDELTVTRILAVGVLLLFLWRYMRKSPAQEDNVIVSLLESRWRADIGNKIKDTKEIAAACLFLVSSFYIGYNAFYFALIAYVVMRLAEYLLLEPKVKILENLFAIAMIAVFFIVIILWAASDYFSPVLAALFLLAFCIVFIMIFWIYGFDWFLLRIRRARGKRSRKW